MRDNNYIVIEGNIGSGKTTLSKMLAKEFNASLMLEEFEENPFLEEFLADQKTNALAVELQFLVDRFKQFERDFNGSKLVADYFMAKSLIFSSSNLGLKENDLFNSVFELLFKTIRKPDLLIYLSLEPEQLLKNIKKRGREFEMKISEDYLSKIHNGYLDFFENYYNDSKVIIWDTSNMDFVSNPEDYQKILDLIKEELPKGVTKLTL